MTAPKFIEIDGKRFVWRDSCNAAASRWWRGVEQPVLFEMREDYRLRSSAPPPDATASRTCLHFGM
jgi:hypothetical protein